jgi:hypothetical protein
MPMKKPVKFLAMEPLGLMWKVWMVLFATIHLHFYRKKMVSFGEMFLRGLLNFNILVFLYDQ